MFGIPATNTLSIQDEESPQLVSRLHVLGKQGPSSPLLLAAFSYFHFIAATQTDSHSFSRSLVCVPVLHSTSKCQFQGSIASNASNSLPIIAPLSRILAQRSSHQTLKFFDGKVDVRLTCTQTKLGSIFLAKKDIKRCQRVKIYVYGNCIIQTEFSRV